MTINNLLLKFYYIMEEIKILHALYCHYITKSSLKEKNRVWDKKISILKILIIKSLKPIIKCKKRTKQNSDYQKTSFVRFLYLRSDFCPSLDSILIFLNLDDDFLPFFLFFHNYFFFQLFFETVQGLF